MITRIQALRYRCFNQLDVRWQRYNVLAGANGSGKSTLLDIPQLFSELLTRGVTAAFHERSPALGAPRVQNPKELTHCQLGGDFGLVIEAQLPGQIVSDLVASATPSVQANSRIWPHTLRYEVRFEIFNLAVQIKEEFLWLIPANARRAEKDFQIGGQRPTSWQAILRREAGSSVVALAPGKEERERERRSKDFLLPTDPGPDTLLLSHFSILHPAMNWLNQFLTRGVLAYTPNLQKMHDACPPGAEYARAMRYDAINLPWMVRKLQEENPRMFTAWVEHVRTALPNITAIDAGVQENDASAYLKVEYQGGYVITSAGLSGGTLAILAMTILPYLPNPPELVCLEEPENGVHPLGIEAILQSLRSLYNSQVWLSTHSPIVLAHTDIQSIILMRGDGNNAIEAVPGEQHPTLRDWREGIDLDLGSLFAAGVFE